MKSKRIHAADLFCGAGGTSTGLALAARELGLTLDLVAINHWDIAIDTHSQNYPDAKHLCESLDVVDPRKAVPGGRLKILIASPECTHHSNARGGRPMNDQSRASAWHVVRWAEAIYIDNILIENVREFRDWGPLGANGLPLKRHRGETYQAFINAMRSLGYTVEDCILNAANYGDPTTRERLFILARRGGKKIHWPEPTHSPKGEQTLFGQLPRWRPAREIIDWNNKGESIFRRKKPLSPNTMKRIMTGLKKFGGQAFVIGQQSAARPRSVDQPIPTIAGAGAISFIEPFLVEYHGGEGNERRVKSVDQPLPVQDTSNRFGLCESFISPIALVEPFIIPVNHGKDDNRAYSIDEPMRIITSVDAWAIIEPYLVKYYGNEQGAQSIEEPLDTIVGRDKFGIVFPELNGAVLNIRFRMLQPGELARAMSFPDNYQFSGNREQKVKQIGNAVPVNLARALCRALLENAVA